MKQNFLNFCSRMLLMLAVLLPASVWADELTVNEGTVTNTYVPVYGSWVDNFTHQQFIIPASSLEGILPGSSITSIKFYSSTTSKTWENVLWNISLGETTSDNLSSGYVTAGAVAYSGAVSIANGEMEVTLTTAYDYQGGNLVVDFSQTAKGAYSSVSFYGVTASASLSRYGYNATSAAGVTGTASSFVPKTTFVFTPAVVGSCARLGAVSVSDILSTGATFSWIHAEGVSQYQYVLATSGAEPDWASATLVSDTFAVTTGLLFNTAYDFYVRSYCGAGDDEKSLSRKVTFRTDCGMYDLAVAPYFCGFEAADGFGSTMDVACMAHGKLSSSSYTNDWGLSSATYANNGQAALALVDGEQYYYGDYSYYSSKAWWAFPQISVPEGGAYEVNFFARGYYAVSGDSLAVYVNRTPSLTGATRIGVLDYTQLGDEYEQFSFDLPAADTLFVIFAGYTAGDDNSGGTVLVDDVVMREKPNCRPSKDFHLVSNDLTSATFAWTPANGELDWKLQYKASDATAFETVNLTDPSFTLTGLTKATFYSYNFILHSVCEGVLSPDSSKFAIDFATACDVQQPQNDSIVFVGDAFTPCFSQALVAGTSSYEWLASSGNYQIQGAFTATAQARALIFPQMSIGENWEVLFNAWASGTNVADSILVYVSENPSLDGATFVGAVKNLATTAPADPYRFTLPESVANTDAYLIFVGYHYNRLYLDNIILTEKPGCMPVSNLAFVGVAADEENDGLFAATFSWNRGGEEDIWAYYYAIKVDTAGAVFEEFGGVDDPADAAEDTLCVIPALDPDTRYVIRLGVQSGCDGGDNLGAAVEHEVRFKTPCVAISAIGFEEGFEDYTKGNSTSHPDAGCWSFLNINEGTYPYAYVNNSSTYVHSGSQSLYFVGSASTYAYAIMPLFAEDLRDFRMNFWYRDENVSSSGKLWVGYMTNPQDESTFVALEEITRTTTMTSAQVSFGNIPAEVENYRIAFKYGGAVNNYYLGIDDVALEIMPSCVAVTNLHVEDITATGAKIAWNPGKDETEWSVEFKQGATVVYKDTIDVPYVLIDTLAPDHTYAYTVEVKAMCDGVEAEDVLPAKLLQFTTNCESVTTFPWVANFEDQTAAQTARCWDNSGSTTTTLNSTPHYVWGVFQTTGNKVLRMYNSLVSSGHTEVNSSIIELPSEEVYVLSFDYSHRASCDSMKVLISKDNGATFTKLGSYGKTNTTTSSDNPGTFEHVEIYLTDYVGEHIILQFAAQSNYGSGAIFLDNISLTEAPSCLKPINVHLVENSVTLHEADFAWEGDAPQYEVSLGTQKAIVNTNGMHMSGLTSGTNYTANIQVRAICQPGDTSEWTAVTPIHFSTECEVITEFPWSNDFEAYTSSMNADNIACWSAEWAQGTDTKAPWSISTTSVASGTKSISSTYISSQTSLSQLALPQMNIPEANAYEFVFKVRRDADSQSYKSDELRIFANTTPDTIGATRLFNVFRQCTGVPVEDAAGTYQYAVTLPNAGEQYIVLQYYSEDGLGIYLDDFTVREIPSCLAASDLHVVDTLIGLDTAVIAWTPYDTENLNARVVIKNGADTIVNELVNDTIYVIRGLNHSTMYALNAYVYTVCDELQAADAASKAISFATECAPVATLPWSVDFENEATGSANVPTCWTRPAGATYPYVYSYSALAGTKSLYYSSSSSEERYIVSPEFGVDLNGTELSFLFKQSSATSSYPQLHVGAVSDPNSMADYVEVAAIERTSTATLQEIVLANIPTTHKYLVFKVGSASSTTSFYVDNIKLAPAPTCVKPTGIHVASVGLDSAVIAWSGDAAQYELIYANTEKADTVLVNDTCFVLRDLTHSTAYAYAAMVRAICAEGDSSKWNVATLNFVTECAPIATLPWTDGFEGFVGCWTLGQGAEAASSYPKSGSKSLKFNKQNAVVLAVLPEFEAELSTLQFSYSWRDEGTGTYTSMGYLKVGYVTDPADAATFVAIADHNYRHFNDYEANVIFFPEDVPAGARIAFYYSGQTGNDYLFVDDVEVRLAPTCKKPANLELVAPGESSATFSWTPNGDESEWIVKCYDAQNALQDSVAVSSATYAINGLLGNTRYTFTLSVQASCGEGEFSEALVKTFTFKTAIPASFTESLSANGTFEADFSNAEEQAKWIMDGAGPNQFTFGTVAAALLNDAPAALYVSNNASTKPYAYTINSSSTSSACRMFELPDVDSIRVEFDWLANGEGNYDYGRAFFAPASMTVEATTTVIKLGGKQVAPGSSSYSSVPTGAVDLGGGKLNRQTVAQSVNALIEAEEGEHISGGLYNIIFFWGNDSSTGDQNPLSICNLKVTTYTADGPATSIIDLNAENGAEKFFYNGNVYIRHNGVIYNVTGQRVSLR